MCVRFGPTTSRRARARGLLRASPLALGACRVVLPAKGSLDRRPRSDDLAIMNVAFLSLRCRTTYSTVRGTAQSTCATLCAGVEHTSVSSASSAKQENSYIFGNVNIITIFITSHKN